MEFMTGAFRQEDRGFFCFERKIVRKRDKLPIVLACVAGCSDGTEAREKDIEKWYREQVVKICAKGSAEQCVDKVLKSFREHEGILCMSRQSIASTCEDMPVQGDLVLFFCMGEECFYAWQGEMALCMFNVCFDRLHIRRLTSRSNGLQCERVMLEAGVGIMLGTERFLEIVQESACRECFVVGEMSGQRQVERRLEEAAREAARNGEKKIAAVFVIARKESEDQKLEATLCAWGYTGPVSIGKGAFGQVYRVRTTKQQGALRERSGLRKQETLRERNDFGMLGTCGNRSGLRKQETWGKQSDIGKQGTWGKRGNPGKRETWERWVACKAAEGAVARDRLRQEAEVQKNLHHPLFARYLDCVETPEYTLLFMEYVEGEDLSALISHRKISVRQALGIALQLAEGLQYLHSLPEPLLYRDLKPENIRIDRRGRVKLLDLGCACKLSEGGQSSAGSRGYAAPEQFAHVGKAVMPEQFVHVGKGTLPGPYSDVYALGRVLETMLDGQKVPTDLKAFLGECTAERPQNRPQGMESVIKKLEGFL